MLSLKQKKLSSKQKSALRILEEGLKAASPKKAMKNYIQKNQIILKNKKILLSKFSSVYLIAIGKAASPMAEFLDHNAKIKSGVVVIPKGSKTKLNSKKFQIFRSGHPVPNKTSLKSAQFILEFLKERSENEFVIFLISGGSSALVSLPNKITLDQKIQVTKELLNSGANIHEINCVRKHLSKIKGGRIIQNLHCKSISFVLSDVLDNDLETIASGITFCDTTTFSDAKKIIKKYKIQNKISKNLIKVIESGINGKIEETPKTPKIKNTIISDNKKCLDAMKNIAEQLKFQTKIVQVSGDVQKVSIKLSNFIKKKKNFCLIFGGEPTVKVTGNGKGGRNQELVLRIFKNLQKTKFYGIIGSIGTDGIDGNTKYAGVITQFFKIKNSELNYYLKNNDSSNFFKKHGGLIKTGYTNTNLLDIGLILV